MPAKPPSLSDLYHLAEQLELDREVPEPLARERDHAIAAGCASADATERMQYWLAEVSAQRSGETAQASPWLGENSAAVLGRVVALFFGFSGMAVFLLASGRGLVNVFMFLSLFVLLQAFLCLVAAAVMARTVGGGPGPVMLPVNPARLLVARQFPDRRYLRDAQSVLRLLFLRYGQELGALFTLGAVAAFFVVLALSHFTFVWGSTFALSDSLVEQLTALMAAPWSAWLPQATVSAELVFASRYHPAIGSLAPADIENMRGWWPFLIMSMLSYALLPRLLLWALSKYFYTRQVRVAFTGLPGAERVLARMQAPLVTTQADSGDQGVAHKRRAVTPAADDRLLLLNWASALAPSDIIRFEPFSALPPGNIVDAGLGSLPQELERLAEKTAGPAQRLYVAVKSWEPPMADLADFLSHFGGVRHCTLYLVPLPHKPVSAASMGDWQVFARGLSFPAVDVQLLVRE